MAPAQHHSSTTGKGPAKPQASTGQIRDMVAEALHAAGGAAYLTELSGTDPKAFVSLIGKVLPLQAKPSGDADNLEALDTAVSPAVQGILDALASRGE